MRYKSNLKDPYDIKEYLKEILSDLYGFSVSTDGSRLSSSKYLLIDNWKEKTGKTSYYNDDSIIIRISDHDLPPSYEGLHNYYDFDLTSKNDKRAGLHGDAMFYGDFLDYVDSLVERKKQLRVKLPIWLNKNSLELLKSHIDDPDLRFFILDLLHSKDSPTKIYLRIKDYESFEYIDKKFTELLLEIQ